ncbi:hypothetical protein CC78DRAFT_463134 [Lojkania enalia]|uniref:alpha-glucosidase n=1 Tax=Lojkania enalia TaxID=147567 RepID=A0A9P4KDX9_9PLEO|nr:hypothetical protein CC78DRAFT_463134 [Didymosphaeria enalia]
MFLVLWGTAAAAPAPVDPSPAPSDIPAVFSSSNAISNCPGYEASNIVETDSSLTADLKLAGASCNIYSEDIKDLKLLVEYQTNERLHVKIFDAGENVFQVHEQVLPRPKHERAQSSALDFNFVEKPFSFSVKRKENGEVLFDTSADQLIFETQYVHLRTRLPDHPNLYGLGEHSDPFRLVTQNYQRVLWNAESPNIPTNNNLYGTHPVYFDHRGDKGTHGVFLLNANANNININRTDSAGQYLEYNTIGGVIDLYFLAGKQPIDVSKQYAEVVGLPAMYPYWLFGFQQCKYGYWDVNMVAEVVGNYSTANIPLEVMWTDIDYMDLRQDFTVDPARFPMSKMRELVDTLHKRDQRYVLILDPGIHTAPGYGPYDRGHQKGVFLKASDDSDYLGVQWAGVVAWPDWFAPTTQDWWTDEITRAFNPETGIDLDGLWVDMNEASNFCPNPGSSRVKARAAGAQDVQRGDPVQAKDGPRTGLPNRDWFNPKYHINNHQGDISGRTLWTNITNYDGTRQYDTHNYYGHMMATATQNSMLMRRPGKRPFVMTRSTFAGSGHKVAHWFGDNQSTWEHYLTSIRQMLAFVAVHQMPMVGSDVCGFNMDASENLCARWAMLGAFQPFYRNHAEYSTRPQEFYQWPTTTKAAQKAIDIRYKLMDYIYTALYYQSTTGQPMINPTFYLYPNDANTFDLQDQWFYGDALLITPVVSDFSDTVTFYLPEDTFYDYWTGQKVIGKGENVTISNVTLTDIPVHVRGGTIIPHRKHSANTTTLLRQQDFYFLIAPDADGNAKGRLYLDDGESIEQPNKSEIELTYDNGKFTATGQFGYMPASGESVTVSSVVILGQDKAVGVGRWSSEAKSIEVEGPWKLSGNWGFNL